MNCLLGIRGKHKRDFSLMLVYNNRMDSFLGQKRQGFTIVEVMLFLALSGFMLVGILAGTGSSIANQRYKDSVQDAVDAIKDAFSFVSDTEIPVYNESSDGRGRSDRVVYGTLLMIKRQTIEYTTIVGDDYSVALRSASEEDAKKLKEASDIQLLKMLNATNINCSATGTSCEPAGATKSQKLKWDAVLYDEYGNNYSAPVAAVLIFRTPRTGAIRTYRFDESGTDGISIKNLGSVMETANSSTNLYTYLTNSEGEARFNSGDVKICVDSNGAESYANNRRMIIIHKNAQSQTDIELVDMDGDEQCLY